MGNSSNQVDPDGFILLWRRSLKSVVWKNANLWRFWSWALMKASHKKRIAMVGYQKIEILPGQFVTGAKVAARETGLSPQQLRTCKSKLIEYGKLSVKTTNKYSIITIINWDTYQRRWRKNNSQKNSQSTVKQQTTNNRQQLNNVNNVKEKELPSENPQQIIDKAIDYLNDKAGVDFRSDIYATQALMIDRINEGFGLDDFKVVIHKKCSQWLNDAKMIGNLRPTTLFAADKFEGYLQEAGRTGTGNKPRTANKLQGIELMALGLDVLTKSGEDKFKEFCTNNKLQANDVEAIRRRVG